MPDSKVLISFEGHLRFEMIESLLNKAKDEMASLDTPLGTRKRVLNIMIESLENINKHGYLNQYKVDDVSGLNDHFILEWQNNN